jgi:predicted N-formylglutamate amidohydrolase
MLDRVRSLAGVCDVEVVRGADAVGDVPDVLFEVPHGATLARHFDELREELRGDYSPGLREFFFVNTDVGAPELALAAAGRVVAAQAARTALVLRCRLPRTFVDCNRSLDREAVAKASQSGEMTPGLPPWIVDAGDRQLLLDRYLAYREVVDAAFAAVCGGGAKGLGLCVHTYAPRSIDVAVDDDVVASLRLAYAPERLEGWPLRAEVDLITRAPDGRGLAHPVLAARAEAELAAAGYGVAKNDTYSLHPSTRAYALACRYPQRTLCLEVRRDLLLDDFVPFVELVPRPEAVERAAFPLANAVLSALG